MELIKKEIYHPPVEMYSYEVWLEGNMVHATNLYNDPKDAEKAAELWIKEIGYKLIK